MTLAKHPPVSWLYRTLLRPALFLQDSEAAHDRVLRALAWLARHPRLAAVATAACRTPALPVNLLGLSFPNPVGMAAGMDKGACALPLWQGLGFGFCELGGVTRHAQPGNERPRMFRALADRALINRMGFNNPGAEAIAAKLALWRQGGRWPSHPVGINLGKSKVTPLEAAAEDYACSFRTLRLHADFFVVNVSSPNTPNLRQLQDKAALDEILAALQAINGDGAHAPKPILVKVAPDLSFDALDEILELAGPRCLAGIVSTNTTITRPTSPDARCQQTYREAGGLSGAPLRARSTEIIRHLHLQTKGALPLIGVGGVMSADDAWEKITAGASLLQFYTGLVYEGPTLARKIVSGLKRRLAERGMSELKQAVGIGQ